MFGVSSISRTSSRLPFGVVEQRHVQQLVAVALDQQVEHHLDRDRGRAAAATAAIEADAGGS